jgi:hypothetical protein
MDNARIGFQRIISGQQVGIVSVKAMSSRIERHEMIFDQGNFLGGKQCRRHNKARVF